MRETFQNLSMQGLSIPKDSVVLKFDAIKKLNKNISDLINSEKGVIISEIQNLNPPTFNNKIESIIVK